LESHLCVKALGSPLVSIVEWYCNQIGEIQDTDQGIIVAMRIKEIMNAGTYKGQLKSGQDVKQVIEILRTRVLGVADQIQA
jgi:hypothetical protein